MINLKRMKPILLTASLTMGLSLTAPMSAYAATYTAVSGDSLFKIGQVFNTTVAELMDNNGLNSISLDIGQVLEVPCKTYTVQKGDTLFLIAKKLNLSLAELRRANNIYTDYLDIGQVLNIPPVSESAALGTALSTLSASDSSSYSNADVDLLARLITAEAQGEPYEAKVAVGAVVVNRAQSGLFPSSIKGVIYQNIKGYYQFTPVVNGWIDKPADADSIKAAKEALNGADPTNNALFYYDNKTTNKWILAKPVSTRIGNMVFAY